MTALIIFTALTLLISTVFAAEAVRRAKVGTSYTYRQVFRGDK
jgi:hypothetical protein